MLWSLMRFLTNGVRALCHTSVNALSATARRRCGPGCLQPISNKKVGARPFERFASRSLTLTAISDFDIYRSMKSKQAIDSLSALAQESRLAIFRMLVKRGPDGYTPTQLGEKLSVTATTLSFHLKELQRAGLIDVRRNGRFLYYRPNFAHMSQLIEFLTENCCALADQGCGSQCAPAAAELPPPKRQRA